MEAHNDFLTPPDNFLSKEHAKKLARAKDAYRAAFVKMATDKSDAKREFAYGVLSPDQISELFKLSRKITWPLVGIGTVASIIGEIMRASGDDSKKNPNADEITIIKDDLYRAINVLDRPGRELNTVCQEAIQHVLCTLQMGKYTNPSPLLRLFSKQAPATQDSEQNKDIGTDAFLIRFDACVDKFNAQRTDNLAQFYDEKQVKPTQGLFLVLFVDFLLTAIAQEIRGLVVFVDCLRRDGSLTRKRFVYPKMKVLRKSFAKVLNVRTAEEISGEGFLEQGGDAGHQEVRRER